MVIRESFGREAKGLGRTQLLALGGKSGWLEECGVFILPSHRILHGCQLPHHRLGNREATPNPVKMQIKRQIPKTQKVREETVKDAERRNLLEHRFQDGSPCSRHLRISEYHAGPIAFMRCPREFDEHPEGTLRHVGPVVVAFFHMPHVAPFTPALGWPGLKTARTSPVTATSA